MILMSWFSTFPGISKTAFSRLLFIIGKFLLPSENTLPTSYTEAVKMVQRFITPVVDYNCCINDCIIYRDSSNRKHAKLTRCPECNENRYEKGSKNTPRKRFKYIPIEPRLRRLFGHEVSSAMVQGHSNQSNSGIISSIHESPAWKEWYSAEGYFQGDTRAVSFGICMDGTNPFAHEKTQ